MREKKKLVVDETNVNRTDDLNRTDDPRNPDPITGEPGSHPVGTGIGAATAGTVGAIIGGVVGGPIGGMVGTAVGGVVGAAAGGVAGGLAGKEAAEQVNPTIEDAYWRENYASCPYVAKDSNYDLYQPAYRYGWESRGRYADNKFEEIEPTLANDWRNHPVNSTLDWDRARPAVRDAWNRIENNRVKKATP